MLQAFWLLTNLIGSPGNVLLIAIPEITGLIDAGILHNCVIASTWP
jgi:hypothetical protein